MPPSFSDKVLAWFDRHGRKHLPWQQERSPYRVWVSEIMLQQTQVGTVIPYFERFMARFPTLEMLAAAQEDEVLHHWTGLGYYARARNLHKAARQVLETHAGDFPADVEGLSALPGIGRSTAGAILSLGSGTPAPILDGNVKRVLCRFHRLEGWPDQPATLKALWALAERDTPRQRCADYNQAMMDLGSLVCRRGNPDCQACPLREDCQAFRSGETADYPRRKPARKLPVKATTMLLLERQDARAVLLQKRPPQGIWGGLWSLPQIDAEAAAQPYLEQLGLAAAGDSREWARLRHTFSHFHLDISALRIPVRSQLEGVREDGLWRWYGPDAPADLGLAAPVKKLLELLAQEE